ncbi:MAG: methionyl-tRNA formyltransferase, partial [Gemmatimonadaceae bacterium]|nr:methionyl-tRNA formyltransferase [Gemmatimonadaceae bacterium]
GEGYDVVGVVTQPDKPKGRSRSTLVASPVKLVALEDGLPILQPEKPRGEEFEAAVRALTPDLSVVVAYGHLLPQSVIVLPPMGTVNVHASLLPRWRGAAPIQAAIRAGDTETGISIMRMVQRMDAGNVLLQAPTPNADDETFGELPLRLSELGALALVEALTLLSLGATREVVQDEARATFARKIDRAQAMIDWTQHAADVARTIRAFDPRPGAFTTQRGQDVKLFGARAAMDARGDPGCVLALDESGMLVACGEGGVRIGYVHPAGKRRLATLDYAQGRGVSVGEMLGDNTTA